MKFLTVALSAALALVVSASPLDATVLAQRDLGIEKRADQTSCGTRGLVYNPKTGKCFNPARHPSAENCNYLGKLYDRTRNQCFTATNRPSASHCSRVGLDYDASTKRCVAASSSSSCPSGTYNTVGDWSTCSSCGSCAPYNSAGTPACTRGGSCTVICPAGQGTRHRNGLVYCA